MSLANCGSTGYDVNQLIMIWLVEHEAQGESVLEVLLRRQQALYVGLKRPWPINTRGYYLDWLLMADVGMILPDSDHYRFWRGFSVTPVTTIAPAGCFLSHVQSEHPHNTLDSMFAAQTGKCGVKSSPHIWVDHFNLRQCAWGEWNPKEVVALVGGINNTLLRMDAGYTYPERVW